MALFTSVSTNFVEYSTLGRIYKTDSLSVVNVSDNETISLQFLDELVLQIPRSVWILEHATVELAIAEINTVFASSSQAGGLTQEQSDLLEVANTGYTHTGAFAGKPLSNNYVWQAGTGISYTSTDASNELFKVFSLDPAVHLAVDNPYWTTPTPSGITGIGLFQGANLPNNVTSLLDFDYVFDDNYDPLGSTGFEGSTGRIKLNDCVYGDQLRVRFDFNAIPQVSNTTIEPALWYSNRDDNDNITFTFPLTAQPIFFGTGTVGKTYLNRIEISAWITSNEDVNALTLPAIKSDNRILIQPLGMLITIVR